jgi:transcription elongation factor
MALAQLQQTQISMFGYLTGQPRAPAVDAPARDAGAQKDAHGANAQHGAEEQAGKGARKGARKEACKEARKEARKPGGAQPRRAGCERKKNTQTSLNE